MGIFRHVPVHQLSDCTENWEQLESKLSEEIGLGFINVRNYGAQGNSIVDDASAIVAAINALPSSGGTLLFPPGNYICSRELDLHGKHSVIFRGLGGNAAGAFPASSLRLTGNTERFINARSSLGFVIEDLMVYATNAGFAGALIDLSHDPVLKSDSAYWNLNRCYLGITPTTGSVVLLDRAVDGTVSQCSVNGGNYGIQGVVEAGSYSNAIKVLGNVFRGQGTSQICGPAGAWTIQGNTFEALAGGKAGGIEQAFGSGSGEIITGNWFGDVTAGKSGTQIQAGSASSIQGNFIGGSAETTGVAIGAGNIGVIVAGNTFIVHKEGIAINAAASDCQIFPNFYNSVTTKYTAPTITVEAGAGEGATAETSGSDWGGAIILKTGKAGRAAGAQVKVKLASTHSLPRPTIEPFAANTASLEAYISALTTTSFTLAIAKAPAESVTYEWFYQLPVIQ